MGKAGIGRRILFGLAALYWVGVIVLLVATLPATISSGQVGFAIGYYVAPLAPAAIVRGVYVLFSRRRPRPRFLSWWLLVIGGAIGLLTVFQRLAAQTADRIA